MNLGDPRQFEQAYRQHAPRVRAVAQRVLHDAAAAEDVAQEVFVRLWQRPQLFDPQRGSLAALVSVMARSRALDRIRAEGALERARDRLGAVHALTPASEEGPAEALERNERDAELHSALLRLPSAQRTTIELAYGRGLNSAQIAQLTRVGRATARSRLRLGLGKLRADLGEAA
jgi:RNA polymerase sigma-70 factor (ECF subfamily)